MLEMNKLILSAGLFIILIGLISFANAQIISDCKDYETSSMFGTQRIITTLYDCDMGAVTQQGLTLQEKELLAQIRLERIAGIYEQPPIQEPLNIQLNNPLCSIEHFNHILKQYYNCYGKN